MAPGNKRHQITIQKVTVNQDDTGNEIESWSNFANIWADVRDISGREYFAAKQTNAEVTTKVTIKYFPGINASMRILHGNRTLYLEGPPIDPDGCKRDLILMCKEVAADG